VAVDCAALPEMLIESELFGYEKGAFTGAVHGKIGLLGRADGGTLFLDEIGAVPLAVQAKLVGVLHERTFYPLGSDKQTTVDVRLITATSRDLDDLVSRGLFREDLFYRIHVIPVNLPPLRERKEDIPPLVDHFLKKIGRQMNKDVKGVSPEAMRKLMLHDWPGNVRELEGAIEHALVMTDTDFIGEDVIPPAKAAVPPEPLMPLAEAQNAHEKNYLLQVLRISGGSLSRAASLAGKSGADLQNLLKKHGLKVSDYKKDS
jgi:two-component system, NtrC family, response regulator GlrR